MMNLRMIYVHAYFIGVCLVIVTAKSLDSISKEHDGSEYGLLQENNNQKTTEPDYSLFNSTNTDCQCKDGRCEEENGTSICKCDKGWGLVPSTPVSPQYCKKCDCRNDRNCTFTVTWSGNLVKECLCEDDYEQINGKCIGVCKEDTCKHGGVCQVIDSDIKCKCGKLSNGTRCENFLCNSGYYGGKERGEDVCKCHPGYGLVDLRRVSDKPYCSKCNCGRDFNCRYWSDAKWPLRMTCLCPVGYHDGGSRCIGDCVRNPCQNGGKCVVKGNDIECRCNDYFTGDLCEKCVCENGYCEDRTCKCPPGFGFVSRNIFSGHYCKKCDCLHDSNCTYSWGGFGAFLNKTCICKEGFEDIEGKCRDKCFFMDCKNGGICQVENGTAFCNCTDRYTGESCETDKCSSVKCKNGGTCDVENGNIFCSCTDRYTGENCETDKCSFVDCKNGGICEFKNGNGFCNCNERFTGKNCETDKCSFLHCENEGICDVLNGTAFCNCTERYTGNNCQTDICSFLDCNNGGTCGVRNGNAFCNCTEGYTGRNCETEVTTLQVTETSTTQNSSWSEMSTSGIEGNNSMLSTVNEPGNLTVSIFENYTESSSMISTEELPTTENSDLCAVNPCRNGGMCKMENREIRCYCIAPFSGKFCEIDPCTSKPCRNGGRCIIQVFSFRCDCAMPFHGTFCEKDTCSRQPCRNGGTCYIVGDNFECVCRAPFAGTFCETDPCMWNPCKNGGICKLETNRAKCFCEKPFTGEYCESSSDIYEEFLTSRNLAALLVIFFIVASCLMCQRIWMFKIK